MEAVYFSETSGNLTTAWYRKPKEDHQPVKHNYHTEKDAALKVEIYKAVE